MTTAKQRLARRFGLEEFNVDINIGTGATDGDDLPDNLLSPVDDEGEPTPTTVEVEATEAEAEVDEVENEEHAIETDTEALESIYLFLDRSLANGGLDTASFEMYNISLDHIYRKYGFSARDAHKSLPSMEAFGDNRYQNTVVSMEETEKALAKFGRLAKNVLLKIWFSVKKMVFNMVNMSTNQIKRADTIIAKAKKTDQTLEKQIQVYSFKNLENNGKIADASTIEKQLKNVIAVTGKMVNGSEDVIKTLASMIKDEIADNVYSNQAKKFADMLGTDVAGKSKIDLYFANTVIAVDSRIQGADDGYGNVDKITKAHSVIPQVVKNPTKQKMTDAVPTASTLRPNEIVDLAENAKQLLKVAEIAKKTYNNKTYEKAIEEYVKAEGKNAPKAEGIGKSVKDKYNTYKAEKDAKGRAVDDMKAAIKLAGQITAFSVTTSKAVLDYCAQSLGEKAKGEKKLPDGGEAKQ